MSFTMGVGVARRGLWVKGGRRDTPWRIQLAVGGRTTVVTPVAPARTWLLTTGWRRHGLIDPDEIPGSQ